MINELYSLSQSLERCRITAEKIHPWIQPLKKGTGLRVVLDQSAHVKKVEYLNKERVSGLWNIKQSNHKMFPVVNLKTPLWAVNDQTEIEQLLAFRKKKRSVAESIGSVSQILQNATFCFSRVPDIVKKIYKFPYEELAALVEEDASKFRAFHTLIEACANLNEETAVISMIHEFSDKFLEALQQGRIDDAALMHSVFFGKWQEKKNSFGEDSITLFFDIDYADMLDHDFWEISSAEMKAYINTRLFEIQEKGNDDSDNVLDAFGKQGNLITKQPQPNLPIVGPSYLMSMNKDAPCHSRYGNIGCSVFPITEPLANAMSDAVIYLTQKDRQGLTWEKVPCGKVGENDLLLVYLERMPDAAVEFANALGGDTENKDFEDYTSAVCDALRLQLGVADNSFIRLLLLQSVSKGQRVVRFETGFTAKEFYQAVKFWCDAARNIPNFYLSLKNKDGFTSVAPRPPFPTRIFESLQFQWLNHGLNRKDIKGGRLGDMYQLFLHPNTSHAKEYLDLLLRRTAPFLIRFKQAQAHPSLRPWKRHDEYETYKKIVLDSIAFTGIVLQILGREKEEYMKHSGYYIGRLLSLADLLHEQYCIHVRNGGDRAKGLPPQLLGNSLMRGAMDNPVQTLARLQERLMVYYAWATKEQGEHIGLAKWAMRQMGEVTEALSELELPTRTNDMMKAEILLGYLAKPEKKEKEATNEHGTTK